MKVSAAKMRQDLSSRKKLRESRAGGGGDDFPLRVAKVTAVDPKRLVMSLMTLTGNEDAYDNVPITLPGGWARHFFAAIPEVHDLCVVGYSPAESGSTRVPYVVGWLVPGPEASYDWMMISLTGETELDMSPKLQEALKGIIGRTRKKMRQVEPGNIMASSSQGSDLILNESVTLANRRGNEIILRDQDQALVTRTLQTFHAGAGVRTYSGMVQRDSALLPTQAWADAVDWASPLQISEDGTPLQSEDFPTVDDPEAYLGPLFTPNPVFDAGLPISSSDPREFLKRGLYIDDQGRLYDNLPTEGSTYGGKRFWRVSKDGGDGIPDPSAEVFSEFRIEVSHTSDGTLPVTEQTDGIDIDRLLPSTPQRDLAGEVSPNPTNRSPNAPMVSLVLGTAVGNDPVSDRSTYGRPLVAQLYGKDGSFAPLIRSAADGEDPGQHAAYLLRVANPYDPSQPEAFMAVTKSGSFRSYFPGSGSESHQEFYQAGKKVVLGNQNSGASSVTEADGYIGFSNVGKGRGLDNLGLELTSAAGAVKLFAGGALTGTGTALGEVGSAALDVLQNTGLWLESAQNAILKSAKTTRISAPSIELGDADGVSIQANSSLSLDSGSRTSLSSVVWDQTVSGQMNVTMGGPKNGSPTNGALRNTKFTGTPLTGLLGGAADSYKVQYGGSSSNWNLGKVQNKVLVGSFRFSAMTIPDIIEPPVPGAGIDMSVGVPFFSQTLKAGLLGVGVSSAIGYAKLEAKKGTATVTGKVAVRISSIGPMRLEASLVSVACAGSVVNGGGVLTDGCRNPLTGRSFRTSASLGVAGFRVGV